MKEWSFWSKSGKDMCYNSVRQALYHANRNGKNEVTTFSQKLRRNVHASKEGKMINFCLSNGTCIAQRLWGNYTSMGTPMKRKFGASSSINTKTSAYFGVKNKLSKSNKKYYRLPKGEYRWNDNLQDYEYIPNF